MFSQCTLWNGFFDFVLDTVCNNIYICNISKLGNGAKRPRAICKSNLNTQLARVLQIIANRWFWMYRPRKENKTGLLAGWLEKRVQFQEGPQYIMLYILSGDSAEQRSNLLLQTGLPVPSKLEAVGKLCSLDTNRASVSCSLACTKNLGPGLLKFPKVV